VAHSNQGNRLSRLISAATKVEANEQKATFVSFLFVFCLMAAYFIMRPARDALASDWTDEQLSWLWTSTFVFSVIAVSVYGGVISRIRFKVMVPAVYVFFASTFVGFYVVGNTVGESDLVNRAFYVWLSVFSLFHLSVFWSFMSGIYNKDQAKRTFAVIATGAMLGAAAGPAVPLFFADDLGALNLLLIGAIVLLLPLPLIRVLERLRVEELGNADALGTAADQRPLSANPFSGFTKFVSNPYLLAIGVFILFYVMMNTLIYY
jgi:AAA family ATP:ADP antiporter